MHKQIILNFRLCKVNLIFKKVILKQKKHFFLKFIFKNKKIIFCLLQMILVYSYFFHPFVYAYQHHCDVFHLSFYVYEKFKRFYFNIYILRFFVNYYASSGFPSSFICLLTAFSMFNFSLLDLSLFDVIFSNSLR